ncbi:MAG: hypothetical protein NTV17_03455 [Burkholderiales bacterium]|nr:hypothetical protein [Burkholderiales bacterium]
MKIFGAKRTRLQAGSIGAPLWTSELDMRLTSALIGRRLARLNPKIERAIYLLSAFATPLVLALFSLIALLAWETQYPATDPQALSFKVLEGSSAMTDPADARDPAP